MIYEKLKQYFIEHPSINLSELCKEAQIPIKSLIGIRNNPQKKIPRKYLYTIVCTLCNYGLTIDDYYLSYDNDTGCIFMYYRIKTVDTIDKGDHFVYVEYQYRHFINNRDELELFFQTKKHHK